MILIRVDLDINALWSDAMANEGGADRRKAQAEQLEVALLLKCKADMGVERNEQVRRAVGGERILYS
jgi:hypothetical protein